MAKVETELKTQGLQKIRMTSSEAIVETLLAEGIDQIYGILGYA